MNYDVTGDGTIKNLNDREHEYHTGNLIVMSDNILHCCQTNNNINL